MCGPTAKESQLGNEGLRVLFSLGSFDRQEQRPNLASCVFSIALFIAFLVAMEQSGRWILAYFQDWHPILQVEVHRQILARHICVDTFSCLLCVAAAWQSAHVLQPVIDAIRGNKKAITSMAVAGYPVRVYTYHPGGFRVALLFIAYQFKNLYDTVVWNDGPEFIFHHIFSILTAYGCMAQSVGYFYALFYFGLSEVSTGILCVLANFDDIHGVPGMGDSFPITKVVVGLLFVVAFVICRCIMWPILSYYFARDILQALKNSHHDPRTESRKGWMRFFLISMTSLSILQVAWLGQIFVLAHKELKGVGLL